MRRLLLAPVILLSLSTLAACGGKLDASTASDSPTDSPTAVVSDTPSPTEVATPTDTPTETPPTQEATDLPEPPTTSTAPVTGGASAGGKLAACDIVTPALLNADIGLKVASAGMPQPSSFSDPNATDCLYLAQETPIVVQATTRADMDAPESSYDTGSLPSAKSIPGADRGYAYVLTSSASGSVATVFVVKDQRALEVELASGGPIDVDQCVKLGTDLVAALSS